MRLGVPQDGFIMTREVEGENLEDLFLAADAKGRAAIMDRLGTLVAGLHRDGFYATVRIRDIICSPREDGESELVLIDRETRNPAPRRYSRRRAKNSLLTQPAAEPTRRRKDTCSGSTEFSASLLQ